MVQKQTRSILAILSTDISGYTEKTEKDESYAFRLIAKHRDIINKYVSESNGFTFKEMGDGTFNKFDSEIDGIFISFISAVLSSSKLWGGMFVAIPTAIPAAPFKSIFGNFEGRTTGSRF